MVFNLAIRNDRQYHLSGFSHSIAPQKNKYLTGKNDCIKQSFG